MNNKNLCHVIPGTNACVDFFRGSHTKIPGKYVYFLSHFHGDHYNGLSEKFEHPIYCSTITARLVISHLGVSADLVHPLPLDTVVQFNSKGCCTDGMEAEYEVVLLDANHCPGAAMVLFKIYQSDVIHLHVGDMRFHSRMKEFSSLKQVVKKIHTVFLDTTYAHPKHAFPPQENSIAKVIELIEHHLDGCNKRKLFLLSAYNIGKEKIVFAIAKHFNWKVYVDARKIEFMKQLELTSEQSSALTDIPSETPLHIVRMSTLGELFPYFRPNFVSINEYREELQLQQKLTFDEIIGILPSGWAVSSNYNKKHSTMRNEGKFGDGKNDIEVNLVPYSEHSNYDELVEFVNFLKPQKVIPTVFNDEKDYINIQKRFYSCLNHQAGKKQFFANFAKGKVLSTSWGNDSSISEVCDSISEIEESPTSRGNDSSISEVCDSISEMKESSITRDHNSSVFPGHSPKNNVRNPPTSDCAFPNKDVITVIDLEEEEEIITVLEKPDESTKMSSFGSKKNNPTTKQAPDDVICVDEDDVTKVPKLKRKQPTTPLKSGKRQKAGKQHETRAWSCHVCTFINTPKRNNCEMCGTPKEKKQPIQNLTLNTYFARKSPTKKVKLTAGSSVENATKTSKSNSDRSPVIPIVRDLSDEQLVDVPSRRVSCSVSLEEDEVNDTSEGNEDKKTKGRSKNKEQIERTSIMNETANTKDDDVMVVDNNKSPKRKDMTGKTKSADKIILGLETTIHSNMSFHPSPSKLKQSTPRNKKLPNNKSLHYSLLCDTYEKVCNTTKRLEKHKCLVQLFYAIIKDNPTDLLPSIYLTTDCIAPAFHGIELSVGYRSLAAAITESTGVSRQKLRELYKVHGDMGDVTNLCKSSQRSLFKPKPLTINHVYQSLLRISKQTGEGSVGKKKSIMVGLIRACMGFESKFLVRTLCRNMRIGASKLSVITAVAQAKIALDNDWELDDNAKYKKFQTIAQHAYSQCPDFAAFTKYLLEGGIDHLKKNCIVTPGIPIEPMLAKVCHGVEEFAGQFQNRKFICEYKYDGQRIQIHYANTPNAPANSKYISIFSRHCENSTERFPDAADAILESVQLNKVHSFVIDGEIVAVDRTDGVKILPFQKLSTRPKKGIVMDDLTVNVCVFIFDIMSLNGESLIEKDLATRRKILTETFAVRDGYCQFAESIEILPKKQNSPRKHGFHKEKKTSVANKESKELVELELTNNHVVPIGSPDSEKKQMVQFFQQALDNACEGLVAKVLLGSPYEPSKRSNCWIKLKQDYIKDFDSNGELVAKFVGGGLSDTLDLVPIGGWYGNGRKAGWISPFLLACWDPENEEYQSVCRCISGFSDEFYKEQTKLYLDDANDNRFPCKPINVRTDEQPSFWFKPIQVWEMKGAELTQSPVHKAAVGLIDGDRGLSMRFPRFIRKRTDKAVEDCATSDELAGMFLKQTRRET